MGELGPAESSQLRSHLERCVVCRHELQWLETEASLFRQREGRQLFVEKHTGRRLGFGGAFGLLAAAAIVLFSAYQTLSMTRPSATPVFSPSDGQWSLEVQSSQSAALPQCSTLPEGVGFHCSFPASVVATR